MAKKINKKIINDDVDYALKEKIEHLHCISEPTRYFEIGEPVIYGCHDKSEILEKFENGKFYRIRNYGIKQVYGKNVSYEDFQYAFWMDIFKIDSFPKTSEKLKIENDDLEIRFYNSSISSLIFKAYRKLNFNPDYQRELVWSESDKISLIDSIFNNIEIGKFAFIELDYSNESGYHYEILDGKQRLTTIIEFYENRFKYKGKFYSELNPLDISHFDQFPITLGEVKEPKDRKRIYRYFIKLNTCGKIVSAEHLNKIKKLYEEK